MYRIVNIEWFRRIDVYQISLTPAGKRPLGRPRLRWKGDIRMNPEEIGINTRN